VTGSAMHAETLGSSLLLIDDDKSLGALIAEYCIPNGFSITTAITAEEGIVLLRQNHFVLVILDVMLPGMGGFEALNESVIRRIFQILMLTTRGASKDCVRGLENGADDYRSMKCRKRSSGSARIWWEGSLSACRTNIALE
jgi:DNA-binding response OmpR family regulator